jgi:cytochrome c oxidase assembly factor CtaG
MKIVVSGVLIAVGLFTLSFWIVGTHGHLMFRAHMLEDWILAGILLICFGIPLLVFIKWFIGNRRQSARR